LDSCGFRALFEKAGFVCNPDALRAAPDFHDKVHSFIPGGVRIPSGPIQVLLDAIGDRIPHRLGHRASVPAGDDRESPSQVIS
jgi:hypothetical protein